MLSISGFLSKTCRSLKPLKLVSSVSRSWRTFASEVDYTTKVAHTAIGLNEDDLALYEMCHAFAENEMAPYADEWDAEKIFPVETLRKAAELGLGGMYVSDEYGGTELSRLQGSMVFETLSGGCTSTTAYLSIHNMCCWMLDNFATQELKDRLLADCVTMDKLTSYCLTEPSSGSDAASLRTSAQLSSDGSFYTLNGSKAFISGAGTSDVYLIMCRTGGAGASGISCIAVEKGTEGLSFGANERKMGWNSQPTRIVNLDNVKVPVGNLIGKEGEGFKIAMKGLDGGRLSIASCSLGAAQKSYELAVKYVQDREQFSKPLASFQTVQFKLADLAAKLTASRLLLRYSSQQYDENSGGKTAACAMAKKYVTDNCFDVCNESLQLFGGYGYLRDVPIERMLRDVRVHQILEGTNEIQQLILSRQILASS